MLIAAHQGIDQHPIVAADAIADLRDRVTIGKVSDRASEIIRFVGAAIHVRNRWICWAQAGI